MPTYRVGYTVPVSETETQYLIDEHEADEVNVVDDNLALTDIHQELVALYSGLNWVRLVVMDD